MPSHYDDPIDPKSLGNSRKGGDANETVKDLVKTQIITQARKVGLGDGDIRNLLAIAEHESSFNPDAANKNSSASGVFQLLDLTSMDAHERLSGSKLIGGYTISLPYDRFNLCSNIETGIAVYLDKKRIAKSNEISKIYKKYNPDASEFEIKNLSERTNEFAKLLPPNELDGTANTGDNIQQPLVSNNSKIQDESHPATEEHTLENRQNYKVAAGDTLWKIAKKHGVSLQELITANPQLDNPNYIKSGDTLTIPLHNNSNTDTTTGNLRTPRITLPEASPIPAMPQPPRDPLTLDLDGNGVKTVSIKQNIHFDFNADGFKEATSWVHADDGLLVWDRNQNDTIDSGRELFGGGYPTAIRPTGGTWV